MARTGYSVLKDHSEYQNTGLTQLTEESFQGSSRTLYSLTHWESSNQAASPDRTHSVRDRSKLSGLHAGHLIKLP